MSIDGSLDSVDIQDIVQLLNLNHSTGFLHLFDDHMRGILYYRDGEIINASTAGLNGEAAAYMILAKNNGLFHFEIIEHNAQQNINRPIHDLVLETARRKDTINNIRTSIKHDNIVYLPLVDVRTPAAHKDFNPFEWQLLSQLDGQTEIKNIIEKQKSQSFECFHVIHDLEKRGIIKRVDIYKILEILPLKKFFGKSHEVHISQSIMEEWVEQSMTYSECKIIEIRTQHKTFGQVPMLAKPAVRSGTILIPPHILSQFEVKKGEKVLIKPIVATD